MIKHILVITLFFLIFLSYHSPSRADNLFTIPVTSSKKIDLTQFKQIFAKSLKNNEQWLKDPLQVTLKFLGPFEGGFQTISRKNDNSENPTKAEIIVIEDGVLDDSLRGARFRFVLHKNTKGIWQIKSGEHSFRCWPKRGHQNFSTELCH